LNGNPVNDPGHAATRNMVDGSGSVFGLFAHGAKPECATWMHPTVIAACVCSVGFNIGKQRQGTGCPVTHKNARFCRQHLPFGINPGNNARHHRQRVDSLFQCIERQSMQLALKDIEPPDGLR
jgi:hypothetical protein